MQHIVIQTGNPEPLLHEDGWAFNGIGRKFSHKFGYGLMDASAMVDVAINWPGVSPQKECLSPMMKPNISLPFRYEFFHFHLLSCQSSHFFNDKNFF